MIYRSKLYSSAFLVIAILCILGIKYPMALVISNVLLTLGCTWMLYVHDVKIGQSSEKHATDLKEAGNAIADVIKVIFDHLKKLSGEKLKTQSKLVDHSSRITRLEQQFHRANSIDAKREAIKKMVRDSDNNKLPDKSGTTEEEV